MSDNTLSDAGHFRMIRLYITLSRLGEDWSQTTLTSPELAAMTGFKAENIRKDLSGLGCTADGRGYKAGSLSLSLKKKLGLMKSLNTGLAGLDSWGALLIRDTDSFEGMTIKAGFDSSQNRLERMETDVPLFPSYEIREVFERMSILIGILASESGQPERNLNRMLEGGARGIVNLTSFPLSVPEGIFYYQADFSLGFLSMISRINGLEYNKPE